ncbi:MAG: O-antigen ligase family protein [Saccharofermentans sp.]|nr:O-antigen ligase family protein [Saccharofermentans sp.]
MNKGITDNEAKLIQKAFTVGVCILLGLTPVLELINSLLMKVTSLPLAPGIMQPVLTGAMGLAGTLMILLYFLFRIKNKTMRFGLAEYFYISLTAFSLLSFFFTKRYFGAINHPWWYRESVADFLTYYFLFYAATRIRDWKNKLTVLACFASVSLLNAIVAFLQSVGIELSYCYLFPPMFEGMNFSYGFTHNPNYYAGLSVVLLALTSGLYLFSGSFMKSKSFKYIMLALSCLMFYTTLTSRARLAWIGDIAYIAFMLVSLLITKRKDILKRLLILTAAFAVILTITYFFTDFILFNVVRTGEEASSGDASYNLGSQRLYMWKFAIESIPGNWLFGVGLDNFDAVFFDSPRWNPTMYSRGHCHNEYLHTMATQGVPAFLNQMALVILAIVKSVKPIKKEPMSSKNAFTWIMLGMLATYMCKAVFDSSVIYTSIYIWPVLGFCLCADKD